MGIRYYAYAFDADATERAVADPHSVLSRDPLADAWGMEPGVSVGVATLEQTTSERDLLYLDKAWRHLQAVTAAPASGGDARPAYRMFEGSVRMHDLGWDPWVRVLTPDEVAVVAQDLMGISAEEAETRLRASICRGPDADLEVEYALEYLHLAQTFVEGLVRDGRGMVFAIQ
jgi:Domain of unknown function (DUF1877)